MKTMLANFWQKIPKDAKPKIMLVLGILVVVVVGAIGYIGKEKKAPAKKIEQEKTAFNLDKQQIEKGMVATLKDYKTQIDEKQKVGEQALAGLQDKFETVERAIAELKNNPPAPKKQNSDIKLTDVSGRQTPAIKLPPPPSHGPLANPMLPPKPQPNAAAEIELIGGIGIDSNKQVKPASSSESAKKKAKKIMLPPSFMPGVCLTGVTAPTVSTEKEEPIPLFFRVEKMAVLPNSLRANLKGCFVGGEGEGRLRDHRVHVRLLRLSCLSKDDQAIIDQEIEGYVVDKHDGKIGMAGHVVAKMGTHVARSAWAALIGGIGQGTKLSTQQIEFDNTTGNTSAIFNATDTNNILKYGIGNGISEGAKELQKFYLKLAEETLPVVETGATKKVTLVIKKGVELEIKNWEKTL